MSRINRSSLSASSTKTASRAAVLSSSLSSDVVDASVGWESGVRVSYIGRDSFLISLDVSWAEIPTTGMLESFSANWIGVSLRYFF